MNSLCKRVIHICFSQEMTISECLAHSGQAINICRMKKGTQLTSPGFCCNSLFFVFPSLLRPASSLSHSQFLSASLIPPFPSLPLCHSLFSFSAALFLPIFLSSFFFLFSLILPPHFLLSAPLLFPWDFSLLAKHTKQLCVCFSL